jgi:hypothetical protein
MALALAVQHHSDVANRGDWVEAMTPPSEARMAVLIREEMERRDRYLREALAKAGMTMADLEDDKWEPLERTIARVRGW